MRSLVKQLLTNYIFNGCLVVALCVVGFFQYQVITKTPVKVYGESMSPTLTNHEIVFTKKQTPHRFDIVTFKAPDGTVYIKRVIGMPGDKIEFYDNDLYVNNVLTPEPYLGEDQRTKNFTSDFKLSQEGLAVVPKDHYFVMGDNRKNSKDSRVIGVVAKTDIHGVLKDTF